MQKTKNMLTDFKTNLYKSYFGIIGTAIIYLLAAIHIEANESIYAMLAFISGCWMTSFKRTSIFWKIFPFFISISIYSLIRQPNLFIQKFQLITTILIAGLFIDCDWKNNLNVIIEFLKKGLQSSSSIILGALAGLLNYGLITAIEDLFKVDFPKAITALPFLTGPLVGFQVYQIANQRLGDFSLNGFDQKINEYILRPFFYAYSAVLTFYVLKLIILQESPKGYASIPASIALIIWLYLVSYEYNEKSKYLRQAFSYFPLIALGLLFYGSYIRISYYGLTPDRVYLIAWACYCALSFTIYFLRRKILLVHQAFFLGLFFLLTSIPIIDVDHLSAYSQISRLTKILNLNKITHQHKDQIKSSYQVILHAFADKEKIAKKLIENGVKRNKIKVEKELQDALMPNIAKNSCKEFSKKFKSFKVPEGKNWQIIKTNSKTYLEGPSIFYSLKKDQLELMDSNSNIIQGMSLSEMIQDQQNEVKFTYHEKTITFIFTNIQLCGTYTHIDGVVFF